MTTARLFCDGASSGNPGPSGIGFVLTAGGKTYESSECIGTATNNVAEYTALLRGLGKARSLGIRNIEVFLDSELLVKQLRGEYRVKNENLRRLYDIALSLAGEFLHFSVSHVPREKNKEADKLARKASLAARPQKG